MSLLVWIDVSNFINSLYWARPNVSSFLFVLLQGSLGMSSLDIFLRNHIIADSGMRWLFGCGPGSDL